MPDFNFQTVVRPLRLAFIFTTAVLSGCATGKSVSKAADVIDDGERNTVLISYDVSLNATDRYNTDSSTSLIVRCGDRNSLGLVPECFSLAIPFAGRRNVDGFDYFTFQDSGARLLQMPYGTFGIESFAYSVVVDIDTQQNCTTSVEKNKLVQRCNPVRTPITANHRNNAPEVNVLNVEPGDGCYAGHLTLVMNDGAVVEYSLDQSGTVPSEDVFRSLPSAVQAAAKRRVTGACTS